MRTSKILAAGLVPLLGMGSGAHAEGTWTLGAIAWGETGYYVGHEDDVELFPYVSFETKRFEISLHDGVAYHAIQSDAPNGGTAQLSFVLTPRWEPDFSNNAIFAGLDRGTAIELGVRGIYESGLWFVEGAAVGDISDTHNGYEASAFTGLQYEAGRFSVNGGVGARYRSRDLNRHLFGVSAAEANATRAAFVPGGSTTAFASITGSFSFTDNIALVGDITVEDLGKMDRSPLVDEGSNTSLALGLIYQF